MNMSRVVSNIINQLGLKAIALPFDEPAENVIQNVLTVTTIPEYSQFVPQQRELTVNLATQRLVDKRNNIYLLPEELMVTPVITVIDVKMPINVARGMYGDVSSPFGVSRSLQGVLVHQAYMMGISQARSEPTHEFIEPNKVRLYGFPRTHVTITVAAEHDPNGESIPTTCFDSFMQLAILDVKMFLYSNLKLYNNVASAFGTIDLKIDDYQGAEAERTALLDQWRETFHLDQPWNFTFM